MQDLIEMINDKNDYLLQCINRLRENGRKMAQSEAEYRSILSEKILTLRTEKVPVTIINDLARGDKDVARKRFQRDVAEVNYNAGLEEIQCTKIALRVLQEQFKQEWNSGGQ